MKNLYDVFKDNPPHIPSLTRGWLSNFDLDSQIYMASYNNFGATIDIPRRESMYGFGEIYFPPCSTNTALFQESGITSALTQYFKPKEYPLAYPNLIKQSQYVLGDWGYSNINGYFLGVLTGGPAMLMADPFASVEVYDMFSTVQIHSYNFLHESGLGTDTITTRDYESGTKASRSINILDTMSINMGCSANIFNMYTQNIFNKITTLGKQIQTSNSDLIWSVGTAPIISSLKPEYDPKIDAAVTPEETYTYKGPPISNELDYQKWASQQLTKEYVTEATFVPKSWIHQRNDGSICIMSKSGSTIELNADGDIIISPSRNLKLQSGKNTTILSGASCSIVSKGISHIHSTDQDVQIRGDNVFVSGNTIQSSATTIKSFSDILETNCTQYKAIIDNSVSNIQSYVLNATQAKFDGSNYVNTYRQTYFNNKFTNIKASDTCNILSSKFKWGGDVFSFSASTAGKITAQNPVEINHIHQGQSEFTYTSAGIIPNVKVIKIETQVPLAESPTINTPTIPFTAPILTKFTENYPSDTFDTFYTVAWQTSAIKTWNSLDSNYPNKNPLLNSNGSPISWSSYKIT